MAFLTALHSALPEVILLDVAESEIHDLSNWHIAFLLPF